MRVFCVPWARIALICKIHGKGRKATVEAPTIWPLLWQVASRSNGLGVLLAPVLNLMKVEASQPADGTRTSSHRPIEGIKKTSPCLISTTRRSILMTTASEGSPAGRKATMSELSHRLSLQVGWLIAKYSLIYAIRFRASPAS